eukprot:TRINITY_DN3807_c0_g1_i1.p1 TRINITY_DN3807_c0_g1~~TRINITY_DN3807_c0_g1_i1.p1  ORF type:complete len:1401 (+),score=243.61 TRINITY_DN3807_c0_g1_i1:535-4203(+)
MAPKAPAEEQGTLGAEQADQVRKFQRAVDEVRQEGDQQPVQAPPRWVPEPRPSSYPVEDVRVVDDSDSQDSGDSIPLPGFGVPKDSSGECCCLRVLSTDDCFSYFMSLVHLARIWVADSGPGPQKGEWYLRTLSHSDCLQACRVAQSLAVEGLAFELVSAQEHSRARLSEQERATTCRVLVGNVPLIVSHEFGMLFNLFSTVGFPRSIKLMIPVPRRMDSLGRVRKMQFEEAMRRGLSKRHQADRVTAIVEFDDPSSVPLAVEAFDGCPLVWEATMLSVVPWFPHRKWVSVDPDWDTAVLIDDPLASGTCIRVRYCRERDRVRRTPLQHPAATVVKKPSPELLVTGITSETDLGSLAALVATTAMSNPAPGATEPPVDHLVQNQVPSSVNDRCTWWWLTEKNPKAVVVRFGCLRAAVLALANMHGWDLDGPGRACGFSMPGVGIQAWFAEINGAHLPPQRDLSGIWSASMFTSSSSSQDYRRLRNMRMHVWHDLDTQQLLCDPVGETLSFRGVYNACCRTAFIMQGWQRREATLTVGRSVLVWMEDGSEETRTMVEVDERTRIPRVRLAPRADEGPEAPPTWCSAEALRCPASLDWLIPDNALFDVRLECREAPASTVNGVYRLEWGIHLNGLPCYRREGGGAWLGGFKCSGGAARRWLFSESVVELNHGIGFVVSASPHRGEPPHEASWLCIDQNGTWQPVHCSIVSAVPTLGRTHEEVQKARLAALKHRWGDNIRMRITITDERLEDPLLRNQAVGLGDWQEVRGEEEESGVFTVYFAPLEAGQRQSALLRGGAGDARQTECITARLAALQDQVRLARDAVAAAQAAAPGRAAAGEGEEAGPSAQPGPADIVRAIMLGLQYGDGTSAGMRASAPMPPPVDGVDATGKLPQWVKMSGWQGRHARRNGEYRQETSTKYVQNTRGNPSVIYKHAVGQTDRWTVSENGSYGFSNSCLVGQWCTMPDGSVVAVSECSEDPTGEVVPGPVAQKLWRTTAPAGHTPQPTARDERLLLAIKASVAYHRERGAEQLRLCPRRRKPLPAPRPPREREAADDDDGDDPRTDRAVRGRSSPPTRAESALEQLSAQVLAWAALELMRAERPEGGAPPASAGAAELAPACRRARAELRCSPGGKPVPLDLPAHDWPGGRTFITDARVTAADMSAIKLVLDSGWVMEDFAFGLTGTTDEAVACSFTEGPGSVKYIHQAKEGSCAGNVEWGHFIQY